MATQAWRDKRRREFSDQRDLVASLQSVLHVGGISRVGLHELIRTLRDQDLGAVNLDALANAEFTRFDATKCAETLTLHDGSTWVWEFCEPSLLVARMLEDSAELQHIFDRAFAVANGDAWHLAVAFDEFTPGNSRQPDNRRKSMVVAFNFLDVGQSALSKDLAWFVPIVVRSCMIAKAKGGFSHMCGGYCTARAACALQGSL